MTNTAHAADDWNTPIEQLYERFQTAVRVAEDFPCEETWAIVEAARQRLTAAPEVNYARAAINRRVMSENRERKNMPAANRW